MPSKLVYVEWCDAISLEVQWQTEEELLEWAKSEDWIVRQVGWIIEETEKYILLAGKISHDSNGDTQVGLGLKIPTTWILKRIDLTKHVK